MEPLRIGILGAARITDIAMVQPAHLLGQRMVAIAARDRARADEYARMHGIERVVGSYQELIDDPDVEVVYNPLPNGLHGPWNLRAIAAGKHVLSEKPSASNAAEALEVRDAARSAGVHVMEAFHYRYHPVMLRMIELVRTGELGEIVDIEVRMGYPIANPDDPRWSLELAGGSVMDVGCYAVHALRTLGGLLGGEPTVASAHGGQRPTRPGVDEWLSATVEFPDGTPGRLHSTFIGDGMDFTLRIIGSHGQALAQNFVLPHENDRIAISSDRTTRVERLGRRLSYAYQLEALCALVREGAPVPTDADDAVKQARLIDACYEAAGFEPRPQTRL